MPLKAKKKIKRSLAEALDALPKRSDRIARFLERRGIVGQQGNPRSCPVASYVQAETGKTFVSVGGTFAACGYVHEREGARLPDAAQRFVHNFDSGHYPYLDAADAGAG